MVVRGFTMIEVLVVMVIVGSLATLGGATYMKSLSRGRDARRLEDMKTMRNGFELYYSRHDDYAISNENSCDEMFADTSIFPSGMPDSPRTGDYVLTCDKATGSYCACALLENGTDYGNSGLGCNFTAETKTHYCVKNLQ